MTTRPSVRQMVSEWTDILEPLGLALHKTEEPGRSRVLFTCVVKAFLDVAAGTHATAASKTMQRPSTGMGHWSLHLHGSRILGNIVHFSLLLPLHSVPLPRKRSGLGGGCLLTYGASVDSCCFCLHHSGFPGIPACSKVMPACTVGHWHTASGPVRQWQKFFEPWNGTGFFELDLIQRASQLGIDFVGSEVLRALATRLLRIDTARRGIGSRTPDLKKLLGHCCDVANENTSERGRGVFVRIFLA